MNTDQGYATTYALITICVLSLLAAVSIGPELHSGRRLRVLLDKQEEQNRLKDAVSEVIFALASDPTPEADSVYDPVWDLIGKKRTDGITLYLEDVSTGINLNTYNIQKLDEPFLVTSLAGTSTAQEIEQGRAEGFVLSKESASRFVPEESIGRAFSLYGMVNPNTTDTRTIRLYLQDRAAKGDEVERIVGAIEAIRSQSRIDEQILGQILGPSNDDLLPILAPVPMVNVNMADRSLIEGVLGFRSWGEKIEDPTLVAGSIWMDRLAGEVTASDISYRLREEEQATWVYDFIGPYTWFWSIRATSETGEYLEVLVVRLPIAKPTESVSFQVLSRSWG